MSQTITALFDTRAEATQAVSQLVAAGIPAGSIRTTPETDVVSSSTTRTAYDTTRDDQGLWASLKDMFMPEEDRHTYAEAMHRGSIMVAATVDDAHAARAEDILEQHGTVELDEREKTWRKEGWTGGATAIAGASASAPAFAATSGSTAALAGTNGTTGNKLGATAADLADEKLQIVEERLSVGKRQVNSGRVKVRSYVVETPVSEKVNLRSEAVKVDQIAVDRVLAPGEDPFKERTIEATAMSEEAVVSKQARVTGEVRVSKTADERVETVQDTVRSTKVDVDDGRVVEGAALAPKR